MSTIRRRAGEHRPALTWGLLFALLLTPMPGCGDDDGGGGVSEEAGESPRQKRLREKREAREGAAEQPAVSAEPEIEAPKIEYVYNPVGRRDPFKNGIADVIVVDQEPITPLQKYDLDQYKIVAVIWGSDSPVAMVQDPEGNGHFLRVGTLVGRNWGKVARINEDSVVVAEEYRDFTGQLNVNEIVMSLPEITTK